MVHPVVVGELDKTDDPEDNEVRELAGVQGGAREHGVAHRVGEEKHEQAAEISRQIPGIGMFCLQREQVAGYDG